LKRVDAVVVEIRKNYGGDNFVRILVIKYWAYSTDVVNSRDSWVMWSANVKFL